MHEHGFPGFEWDERKHKANFEKHGVSFIEARSVFLDERGILLADPDHSVHEDRFVLIGMSAKARLVVVNHCYRKETIRIISARKASISESADYSGFQT
jgi:uncharacterized DUF497 family protein